MTLIQGKVITTKELADYLKLNEKTVIKMAQKGELPGAKLGNQWRFNLEMVDSYLQQKIMKSSDEELDVIINPALPMVSLARLTAPELIDLNFSGTTAESVLWRGVELAEANKICKDPQKLFSELKNREMMLSTAIGEGIAVPHPRNPSPELFNSLKLIIVRAGSGIDFSAWDEKPVNLFFMICALEEASHLRILADVAKLVHREKMIRAILSAADTDAVMRILMEFDRDNTFRKDI